MTTRAEANRARAKHGHAVRGQVSRTYHCWQSMLSRCTNPGNIGWLYYGGRGIKVCAEWRTFPQFYADMGDPPSATHSLDRIDTDGDYCKENCRWATKVEQDNNRTNNRRVNYQGRTQTIKQWSRELGIKYATLYRRIVVDEWAIETALTQAVRPARDKKDMS